MITEKEKHKIDKEIIELKQKAAIDGRLAGCDHYRFMELNHKLRKYYEEKAKCISVKNH